MEYIPVLNIPEGRIDIERLPLIERERRGYLRRLFSHAGIRFIVEALLVITLVSTITLLYVQQQKQDKLLTEDGKNIKNLQLLMEMVLQNETFSVDKDVSSRTRHARTVRDGVPHFYLQGATGYSNIDATDENGIFKWKKPEYRSFNRRTDHFYADINSGTLKKVHILRTGVYFVFAKATANGRDPFNTDVIPPIGLYLMKDDEILEVAWTTQDERGRSYTLLQRTSYEPGRFPIDTVTVLGLHRLQSGDEIYVKRPPDRIWNEPDRFLVGDHKLQFGAFLVEECLSC